MRLILSPDQPKSDISREIEKLAARLQAAHAKGKRFLVVPTSNPLEAVKWIAASFYSPLAVVPVNSALPEAERSRMMAQLPMGSWIEAKDIPDAPSAVAREKSSEEIWAVLFSSGSSGSPKGIALSGRALRESAAAHIEHSGRHDWLLNLPVHHIGGFSVISRAFFFGTKIAISEARFSATDALAWLRSGRVEGMSLVPTTLSRLIKASSSPLDFSHLRLALIGGAPTPAALAGEARAAGIPIKLTYGLTENSSQAATERKGETGMRPLPGVEIRISDEGEILLRSPFLAEGIFLDGALQPLPLSDGFYSTGDLGTLSDDRLKVVGRRTEMMISGGVKIFPAELENALVGMPGLLDAAAISLPDAEWGEKICLAIVGDLASPDNVKSYLSSRLDNRKMPKAVVRVPQIPRSSTGKILRAELRQLVSELLAR